VSEREGCALVTGASRGIGAAVARGLAADGWPVAVNFRSRAEDADRVVAEIGDAGGRAFAVQADVVDPGAIEAMFAAAEERHRRVLVLVNNAGVARDNLSPAMTDEEWDDVIATDLSAAFRTTRRAVRGMMRARFGRIVNVASVVALRANPGQANYAAAKAGLVAMTRTVAAEIARRGVTVNAVAPGLIETEMTAGLDSELFQHIPARRAGRPDEVAAAVRFLASEAAGYVTGATLSVDGGLAA
jgi:3-oxoacyl-[acyl-carrier protein] reductase